MTELKKVLQNHALRYPAMEPTDAVKLLYQNEFGGGHLIRNEQACLDYLRQEYEGLDRSRAVPLIEDIGNGLVRVYLAALDDHGYSIEDLGRDFLRSAKLQQGNMDSFLAKLDLLVGLTVSSVFSFSLEELDAYLDGYKKAGCPMVSHSPAYRQAYGPAYRVLRKDCISIHQKT